MATVKFLTQGIKKEENHRNNLEELIEMEGANEIILSSAFLTSDGVFVLKESLEKNKDKVTVYVGCRNGITSKQGVSSLVELGITTYVVDTGSGSFIFHPKAFAAVGTEKALSTVGSANFTYGGLINNIESSVLINLDLSDEDDKSYIEGFRNSFEVMKERYPENLIKVTSLDFVEQLFEEGRLIDETVSRAGIKGTSKGSKRIAPTMKLERQHVPVPKKKKNIKNREDSFGSKDAIVLQEKSLKRREVWKSRELKTRDLNIQNSGSSTHVTGSMLLKKGLYDIDQQVYFRNVVFDKLDWGTKEGKPDHFHYATARIYFIIEGVDYGIYNLEIKHDIRTNTKTYDQRQPMTHLLWGEAKPLVANRNLLDKELTLYEVLDGPHEYIIEIDEKR